MLARDDAVNASRDDGGATYLAAVAEVVADGGRAVVAPGPRETADGRSPSWFADDDDVEDVAVEMLVNDDIFLAHTLTEEPR